MSAWPFLWTSDETRYVHEETENSGWCLPRQETCACLALGGLVTSSDCPPHGHALLCADTKAAR